ncbi:hypothetical protein SRIMR7_40845 [Streptomyces rimosus subsp. rimosus]|uniref:Uncharacterized protein n=1 Tax=Streptomyces rimosus subsp. rimosus TaxID=132474 RepID=A0ABY3ZDX1_STRRM|nr:hypothetical protein SRIMR7_40845 [Streptomyces rimosus subsp. rimosus]
MGPTGPDSIAVRVHQPMIRWGDSGLEKVIDDDMAAYAHSLRANGVPVLQIASKLVINSGMDKGEHPLVATVYHVLAKDDVTDPTA